MNYYYSYTHPAIENHEQRMRFFHKSNHFCAFCTFEWYICISVLHCKAPKVSFLPDEKSSRLST